MAAQDQQSRAECRKAFEFELIENHCYTPNDLKQRDGFYVDDDVQFAWECAWGRPGCQGAGAGAADR